ncbi:MAG: hypothetical protein IJA34_08045 [Lachnospiraceae bacterium]|nr:hypothetical protein [Lachnospiraceae bacterium]
MATLSDIITISQKDKELENMIENSENLLKHTVINMSGVRCKDIVLFTDNYEITTLEDHMTYSIEKQNKGKFSVSIINMPGQNIFTLCFDDEKEAIDKYNDFCERALEDIPMANLQVIR